MRKATRAVATLLGLSAGLAGLEHGYFEILQGNVKPGSFMIASMGAPCVPEKMWNACEPALTVIPSFLISGILTMIVSLAILVWTAAFVQRRPGGAVLILLSVALLPVGGGIFPPLIGIIGGATGTRINAPLTGQPSGFAGGILRLAARLWPWPLVLYATWILGQWVVGYFFNEFLQKNAYLSVFLILALLPLSIFTAFASDFQHREGAAV